VNTSTTFHYSSNTADTGTVRSLWQPISNCSLSDTFTAVQTATENIGYFFPHNSDFWLRLISSNFETVLPFKDYDMI